MLLIMNQLLYYHKQIAYNCQHTRVIVDWLSYGRFQLPRWCASQSQYLKWDHFILQNKTDTD